MDKENFIVQTFDLNGNLINENTIPNIQLDYDKLKYSDGLCALYINGMDGHYVTMIDTQGNFLFNPVEHNNMEYSDLIPVMFSQVSDGLLRIAADESTTIFLNQKGETVIELPYNINCISNCENGRIAVNTEENLYFYVDAKTGKYIYPSVK